MVELLVLEKALSLELWKVLRLDSKTVIELELQMVEMLDNEMEIWLV